MSAVCAVVVTYYPSEDVLENLAAIRRQVRHTIVVDNTGGASVRGFFAPLAGCSDVELVFNAQNLGVASAFNQGFAIALARGDEWVATFDQDSKVPVGFVEGMLRPHCTFAGREHVAILSPLYRDLHIGRVYSAGGPIPVGDSRPTPVHVTASSGNLVSTRALQLIGGLRDDLFIDCVDFEFCLRCRMNGWLVLEVRSVVLDHAQGRWEMRRWLWRRPAVNDYAAARRYYQARNRLVLYSGYWRVDPGWILRDAWAYSWDLLKMLMFCRERPRKIMAVFLGYWHALSGRRGRWDPPQWWKKIPGGEVADR